MPKFPKLNNLNIFHLLHMVYTFLMLWNVVQKRNLELFLENWVWWHSTDTISFLTPGIGISPRWQQTMESHKDCSTWFNRTAGWSQSQIWTKQSSSSSKICLCSNGLEVKSPVATGIHNTFIFWQGPQLHTPTVLENARIPEPAHSRSDWTLWMPL